MFDVVLSVGKIARQKNVVFKAIISKEGLAENSCYVVVFEMVNTVQGVLTL